MAETLLKIENLTAKIGGKKILDGFSLEVKYGEVHAVMGPNGSGKSTFSKVIAGHPDYEVVSGDIKFDINGSLQSVLGMTPDERAREGLYLSFQYPTEIEGLTNENLLKTSFQSILKHQGAAEMTDQEFSQILHKTVAQNQYPESFLTRGVNAGMSGGEKKRNEVLQMALLKPRLALLDEVDSGLDIDALKLISEQLVKFRSKYNAMVLITHYQRLLNYIKPDVVHIFSGGKIIKSGTAALALEVEKEGYEQFLS